jgi:flagellar motor switch protein FliN/FliY
VTARQTEHHGRDESDQRQAPDQPLPAQTPPAPGSLSRLGDIEVRAAVEVGAADLLLRDVAALEPGSVVRLDRLVGEPAELTVNGRLFARGDLVVVGDRLGLRITGLTDGVSTG